MNDLMGLVLWTGRFLEAEGHNAKTSVFFWTTSVQFVREDWLRIIQQVY